MWNLIKGLLSSKKVAVMLAGVIVAAAGKIGLELPTETVALILSPILMYIAGQGWADRDKEAAKVNAIAAVNSNAGTSPAKQIEAIKSV